MIGHTWNEVEPSIRNIIDIPNEFLLPFCTIFERKHETVQIQFQKVESLFHRLSWHFVSISMIHRLQRRSHAMRQSVYISVWHMILPGNVRYAPIIIIIVSLGYTTSISFIFCLKIFHIWISCIWKINSIRFFLKARYCEWNFYSGINDSLGKLFAKQIHSNFLIAPISRSFWTNAIDEFLR